MTISPRTPKSPSTPSSARELLSSSALLSGWRSEAFGAVNYAIEGTTGEWTRLVLPAFRERYGEDSGALLWLTEHAEYDDAHPREAFELIKITVRDEAEHAKVESSTRRSLELFRRGFDASFHAVG